MSSTILIRPVTVTIEFGDVRAQVVIEEQPLSDGLRAELHRTIDRIADQLNLGPTAVGNPQYPSGWGAADLAKRAVEVAEFFSPSEQRRPTFDPNATDTKEN